VREAEADYTIPIAIFFLAGVCALGFLIVEVIDAVNSVVARINAEVAYLLANPLLLAAVIGVTGWLAVAVPAVGLLVTSKYLKRRQLWPRSRAEFWQLIFPRKRNKRRPARV
jgi:hypothetical protein